MTKQEAVVSPARPPAIRRPLHRLAHPECPFEATTWGACDKARDDAKADWDAMQQVILAYRIVIREQAAGKQQGYREKGLFDQLVRYIRGQQADITNEDGNPHVGPWALRLRAAIERFKAGDLPSYNLYTIPGLDAPVQTEGTCLTSTAEE